ncbi:hypothetical protein AKO1_007889 [Acrasis kona]|uniref:Uncharacterized protein n=1 Tax=Acrasis kona TaxID=1008807 RepID=A0AAW2YPJ9_9EUKA
MKSFTQEKLHCYGNIEELSDDLFVFQYLMNKERHDRLYEFMKNEGNEHIINMYDLLHSAHGLADINAVSKIFGELYTSYVAESSAKKISLPILIKENIMRFARATKKFETVDVEVVVQSIDGYLLPNLKKSQQRLEIENKSLLNTIKNMLKDKKTRQV